MDTFIQPLILAGGRSERFGQDKALYVWRGRPLIDHVLSVVRLALDPPEVWIGVGHSARHPRLVEYLRADPGLHFLEDDPGLDGPASGLVAALTWAQRQGVPWVWVCACDMPHLRIQLLAHMVDLARQAPPEVTALVPEVPGEWGRRYEPLHALYRPEAVLTALAPLLEAGEQKLQHLLRSLPGVMALDPGQLEAMDPAWRASLANINTKDDLDGEP